MSGPTGSPWTGDQLSRLLISNLVALAVILTAAYGAAQSDETQTTLLWFNLAIAGIAMAAVANALWLLRCRQAVGTAREVVFNAARSAIRISDPEPVDSPSHEVAWAPALKRYHRTTCALVKGKPVERASATALGAQGLAACEVCLP